MIKYKLLILRGIKNGLWSKIFSGPKAEEEAKLRARQELEAARAKRIEENAEYILVRK